MLSAPPLTSLPFAPAHLYAQLLGFHSLHHPKCHPTPSPLPSHPLAPPLQPLLVSGRLVKVRIAPRSVVEIFPVHAAGPSLIPRSVPSCLSLMLRLLAFFVYLT